MTEDQIRGLLREMRDEPVPADSLARVRAGVAVRRERRPFRWWWFAMPAAAAAAALVLMLSRPAPKPVPAPMVSAVETAPVVLPTPPEDPPVAAAPVRTRRKPVRKPAPIVASGPAIRIETADPEVVLLFVTDGGDD